MRYRHFRAFADTIRANGETLACEYRSVLTATRHEFDSFMAELENPFPDTMGADLAHARPSV